MDWKKTCRERAEKKRMRFGQTHLGASRCSGNAGEYSYPYIAYHESGAANYLELGSILSVIIGMGMMYVFFDNAEGFVCAAKWAAGIFLVYRALALAARGGNNASVKKRIAADVEYAMEFAVKYPEQAALCRELNETYAVHADAFPEEEIRARIAEKEKSETHRLRMIGYALFGLFLLLSAALIGFFIWAYRETT